MEQEMANRLVEENLSAIYGFALSRLGDVAAAEALASDIVYAVLSHAHQLRDAAARYGWLWQIARSCLAAHFRGERQAVELDETIPDGEPTPEEALILREDLARLRRELALLASDGRRATVLYYIDGLSCGEVASRMQISVEMVKYHLFRTRKTIREGIQMERIYGERSYHPEVFEIDFYGTRGGNDDEYRAFAERRLLGNILLATYYTPMRLPELSLELGVATPYLEDELVSLLRRKYLVERQDRYVVTNIPIFTAECRAEIDRGIASAVEAAAQDFAGIGLSALSATFGERMADENHLRWQALLLAAHFALLDGEKTAHPLPENEVYALVNGGGQGYVWGRSAGGEAAIPHDVEGIYNGCPSHDRRGSMIAINFGENLGAQRFEGGMVDPLVAAVFGGSDCLERALRDRLEKQGYLRDGAPNFVDYSMTEYHSLRDELAEPIACLRRLFAEAGEIAARICAEHAPVHIRETAREVGAMVHQHTGLSRLTSALCATGCLTPVTEPDAVKPTVCVIRNK